MGSKYPNIITNAAPVAHTKVHKAVHCACCIETGLVMTGKHVDSSLRMISYNNRRPMQFVDVKQFSVLKMQNIKKKHEYLHQNNK